MLEKGFFHTFPFENKKFNPYFELIVKKIHCRFFFFFSIRNLVEEDIARNQGWIHLYANIMTDKFSHSFLTQISNIRPQEEIEGEETSRLRN